MKLKQLQYNISTVYLLICDFFYIQDRSAAIANIINYNVLLSIRYHHVQNLVVITEIGNQN